MDAARTGSLIAERRKEQGLTQRELAERLHVSDKAVSRWETGRGCPDINSLEAIAQALDVSTAELLRGERFCAPPSAHDVEEAAAGGLSLGREFARRRKAIDLAVGFLLGLLVLTLLVVHLMSPLYLENAAAVETLADGRLIAVLDERTAGWDADRVTDPDTGGVYCFLSCYETLWSRLWRQRSEQIILLDRGEEIDRVYYYPAGGADQLLYIREGTDGPGGVKTLPRLVYNYWLLLGAALTLGGGIAYFCCRGKRWADRVLMAAALPAAFTAGTALILAVRAGTLYNASYYLTGILLASLLLYALFLVLYERWREKKR